ncbi:molybdopterin-dependent oxidoreductase [Roseateles oligotrophus]|uniref:Molybdopterin-dependent oxidoreductase n=1 Tax=Roseateles oligotrophus TaxID=1769250 RepID=A0ABT2YKN5_9BURK|nr:molybdopterin-dependent oxidoreductase [Roseateles oligotrophus]MCV2370623.1 molybdopterin-dependent oxidoreductase [Roseateles oligotrophus]
MKNTEHKKLSATGLPPGQRASDNFPRFGLTQFAIRFPTQVETIKLRISGELRTPIEIGFSDLRQLPRIELTADFHCVTTWTHKGLQWSGVRFRDFYQQLLVPKAGPASGANFVILRGQDGARSCMLLEDLLADDVLLADSLNGQALSIAHGAPLRLLAPAHYGYKSVKHLDRIEFRSSSAGYRPSGYRFMEHPRARVALEERGRWLPNWLLRLLYRPLIGPTAARFERALRAHQEE